jgi:phosphate butyryltransferase
MKFPFGEKSTIISIQTNISISAYMSSINSFKELFAELASQKRCATVAVVCPYDEETCGAVAKAINEGFIKALLVGEKEKIAHGGLPQQFPDKVEIVETADVYEAATAGVKLVHDGKAEILMKGLVGTDVLLHAVLNKETGILPKGELLTHVTVSEISGMNRLLFYSDVAVIPYPTLEQREKIIMADLALIRKFGIARPKVALIHFTEKVNPKFPNSVDYQTIVGKAEAGEYGDMVAGGPMDVKTAVDLHSAQVKGIQSEVCGNADLLIFPNIESGNTFYKTISYFAKAQMAGMLIGPTAPVVLPSRSDSAESKYNSLALAALASQR